MQYLTNTQIIGNKDDVNIVRRLFGSVYFGGIVDGQIALTLTKVLPNCYVTAEQRKHSAARIYVVIPDGEILKVWPGHLDVDEVKLAIATREGDSLVLTQAMAVRRGITILYLCLSAEYGELINEEDSLGI